METRADILAAQFGVPRDAVRSIESDTFVFVAGHDLKLYALNWSNMLRRAPRACVRPFIAPGEGDPPTHKVLEFPGWFVDALSRWTLTHAHGKLKVPSEHIKETARMFIYMAWKPGEGDITLCTKLSERISYVRRLHEHTEKIASTDQAVHTAIDNYVATCASKYKFDEAVEKYGSEQYIYIPATIDSEAADAIGQYNDKILAAARARTAVKDELDRDIWLPSYMWPDVEYTNGDKFSIKITNSQKKQIPSTEVKVNDYVYFLLLRLSRRRN